MRPKPTKGCRASEEEEELFLLNKYINTFLRDFKACATVVVEIFAFVGCCAA
jgi:hypothetical protein